MADANEVDIQGTAAKKPSELDKSSVYMTPESSPLKDQSDTDNAVSNGITDKTHISQTSELLQNSYIHGSALVFVEKDKINVVSNNADCCVEDKMSNSVRITNGLTEPMKNTQERNVNGQAVEEAVSVETFEKPVLSHSPCSYSSATRSKAASKTSNPSPIASSESSAVSSPMLSRPKIPKEMQLKKAPGVAGKAVTGTNSSQTKPKAGRRKKKESAPGQTSTITDFFPVRRSGRQTKREIEKEQNELLEKLIASNCEDGLEVKQFDGKGRGVVATKAFGKGDFVIEYAGEHIDVAAAREREEEYSKTPEVGCYMYYFTHGGKHYCVDATSESGHLGRLINHSRVGNCCTKVVPLKENPRLILVAARDIKVGEELSYDYGDRRKSSIDAHPWLKL